MENSPMITLNNLKIFVQDKEQYNNQIWYGKTFPNDFE